MFAFKIKRSSVEDTTEYLRRKQLEIEKVLTERHGSEKAEQMLHETRQLAAKLCGRAMVGIGPNEEVSHHSDRFAGWRRANIDRIMEEHVGAHHGHTEPNT